MAEKKHKRERQINPSKVDGGLGERTEAEGDVLRKKLEEARQRTSERMSEKLGNPDFEGIARQGGTPKLPSNQPGWASVEQVAPLPPKEKKPKRLELETIEVTAPDGTTKASAQAAAREFAGKVQAKIALKPKLGNDPTKQYYMECHVCCGPGIFFVRKPIGKVNDNDWFSSYKGVDDPWMGDVPVCQCCYDRKKITPLRVLWNDNQHTGWQVYPRLVKSIDKKDLTEKPEEVTSG